MEEAEFDKWLIESTRALKKTDKPISEFQREESYDILRKGLDYREHLRQYLQARGVPDAYEKAWLIVKDICRVYLDATAYQRAAIRNAFDSQDGVISYFGSYPSYVAEFIRSPDDVEWLRLGLAGALIEDGRTDYRDTYVALGNLYLAAERHGIDPAPYFESEGTPNAKGNPPSRGLFRLIGGNYSQSLLTEFLGSEFLKSVIKKGESEW